MLIYAFLIELSMKSFITIKKTKDFQSSGRFQNVQFDISSLLESIKIQNEKWAICNVFEAFEANFLFFSFFSAFTFSVWHSPNAVIALTSIWMTSHLIWFHIFNASKLCAFECIAHTDFLLSFFPCLFFHLLYSIFSNKLTFNWREIVLFVPFPHHVCSVHKMMGKKRKKFVRSWHTLTTPVIFLIT